MLPATAPCEPIRTFEEALPCGLPDSLREIQEEICRRVIGQEAAAKAIVEAIARFRAGLAGTERPVGAFLLLGPTGVGKTLTAEVLADILHGSPRAVLKVHCAELRSEHELARLKGAPPGYVGWKDCVPLLHETRLREVRLRDGLAVVLFDEIEKAHPALWDLLLGMLDKGEVLLNDNTRVDFRRTIIFLTSNTGAREIESRLVGGMGFSPPTGFDTTAMATQAAARVFSPEFRNRLSATIAYRPLARTEVVRITRLELEALVARLRDRTEGPVSLWFTPGAVELIAQSGFEPKFGARHIKRAIECLVENPLANLLAGGTLLPGDRLSASASSETGTLRFDRSSCAYGEAC